MAKIIERGNRFKLGQKVLFRGEVTFQYNDNNEKQCYEEDYLVPKEGTIVGVIQRCLGKYSKGSTGYYDYDSYDPPTFTPTMRFSVYQIKTSLKGPITECLEYQLTEVKS